MRISHFFIARPIFAAVISIVFVILGGVAFFRLPIAQYPEIAPPVINVTEPEQAMPFCSSSART